MCAPSTVRLSAPIAMGNAGLRRGGATIRPDTHNSSGIPTVYRKRLEGWDEHSVPDISCVAYTFYTQPFVDLFVNLIIEPLREHSDHDSGQE